tara:strand:+ start:2967 stop:3269 length:303 start_codon:yes stop_codon:yes gene_type:complete
MSINKTPSWYLGKIMNLSTLWKNHKNILWKILHPNELPINDNISTLENFNDFDDALLKLIYSPEWELYCLNIHDDILITEVNKFIKYRQNDLSYIDTCFT